MTMRFFGLLAVVLLAAVVRGDCTGKATYVCQDMKRAEACTTQAGCYWLDEVCVGQPPLCSSLGSSERNCVAVSGCKWSTNPLGGYTLSGIVIGSIVCISMMSVGIWMCYQSAFASKAAPIAPVATGSSSIQQRYTPLRQGSPCADQEELSESFDPSRSLQQRK